MFKLLIIVCALGLSYEIGRNPTASDHAVCRFRYASEYNAALARDLRTRIQAYNNGTTGNPCRTNCRLTGASATPLRDTESPNYLQCGTGMYCFKSRCVVPPSTSVTDA